MLTRQIIFFSIVLLTIGWILWRRGNRLFKNWKKSEALIVRNIYTRNSWSLIEPIDPQDDETGTYHTVIEFKTDKNETITKRLDIGGYPPRAVGERIKIIYNPNDPINFITYPRLTLKIIPCVLVTIGLIGVLACSFDFFGIISLISD